MLGAQSRVWLPDAECIRRQSSGACGIRQAWLRARNAALRQRAAMTPIGYVRSGFTETKQIPKDLRIGDDAEGVLEIISELELGLTDVEGFSHLYVIWQFHRAATGVDLMS